MGLDAVLAPETKKRLQLHQARVFALSWVSYASYYLTRKNLSVVKSRLIHEVGVPIEMLGVIDSLYSAFYAGGQFLNGALGDRFGARRLIGAGMIGSAMMSVLFGWGSGAIAFLAAFSVNGYFQSTGWSNNVKAMAPWFGRKTRGKVMGFWCTCYVLGSIAGTALAALLLEKYGWRAAFRGPAIWVALVGVLVLLFLVEKPEKAGLPPVEEEPSEKGPDPGRAAGETGSGRGAFAEMIRLPEIWAIGGAYFGLKLIRYSLLFWLPLYLHESLGYAEGAAGYLSTAFEVGGVIGAIASGWASDRLFPENRSRLVAPMLFALTGALWLYAVVGGFGWIANAASMGLIGLLLYGPDALLSGAMAQDLGHGRAAASAAGIINGIGSIGQILGGLLPALIQKRYGWESLFYVFIFFAFFSAATLVPLAFKKAPAEAAVA